MPLIEHRTGLTGTVRFSKYGGDDTRRIRLPAEKRGPTYSDRTWTGRGCEETKLATASVGRNSETRRTIGPRGMANHKLTEAQSH
jgi:hypothetical protein